MRERSEECRNLPPTAIYDIDEKQEQGVRVAIGNVVFERASPVAGEVSCSDLLRGEFVILESQRLLHHIERCIGFEVTLFVPSRPDDIM